MSEIFNIRSITESHFSEWHQDSAVSELITELNVRSLSDPCHIDELLNRNANNRWKHWEHGGGWAVIGVDPETDEPTFDGAQFKPDTPVQKFENGQPKFRRDGSPDYQKYFSASATEATPLFLNTGIPGYWSEVLTNNSQLLITEGAKKAGAALSAGEATISIPGVTTGQRKGKLKKDLARYCTVGRTIILAFDSDLFHNPNICKALDRLGKLILERGSLVRVLLLPRETKGIDDFIVTHGAEAFKTLVDEALIFEEWRKEFLFDKRKGQILSKPDPNSTDEPLLVPMAEENYILKAQSCLYSNTQWISSKGILYQWVGTHYQEVDKEEEKRRISAWCASTPVMTIDGWLYKYATDTHVQNIYSWVLTSVAVASSRLNPPGINCLNGTITLSWEKNQPSWKLEPHNPDIFYTYVSQIEFDKSADPTSCDRLLECLEPDQREIFLKTLAATLDLTTIRKFCGRDVKAILCLGKGNNGKDALREATKEVYGSQGVVSTTVSDFQLYDQGKKFYLAKLEHARISWSSENSSVNQLDNIQALKQAITGDPLDIERKTVQDYSVSPNAVFFFNINDAPNLQASMEAIKSRWAVLSFNKTFKSNADPSKGELEADSRFRYDPEFLRKEVAPALLNKMLAALSDVARKGIDYSCTEAALQEIQREMNHLRAFCQDVRLDYLSGGQVYMGELHKVLYQWYIDNGYLTIITNSKGEQKKDWTEPARRGDKLIKVSKDVYQRFQELFPTAKTGTDYSRERAGQIYLEGIGFTAESLTTTNSPNAYYNIGSTAEALNSGAGDVIFGNTTKNFPTANHQFKVGDRVKAKHPTTYGIPEDQELTINSISGDIAAVNYEGCRQVFGINIPVSQLSLVPAFKINDRVAHSNPGQKSYNWHGRIIAFHQIGSSLMAEVKWRESRRKEPFVYKLSDLRLI